MHAASIGEGLQRPGHGEAAIDRQPGAIPFRRRQHFPSRQRARCPALINPPPFNAAAMRIMVVIKLRFTAKGSNSRAEFHLYGTAPEPIPGRGCQLRAGDTGRDLGRVGKTPALRFMSTKAGKDAVEADHAFLSHAVNP